MILMPSLLRWTTTTASWKQCIYSKPLQMRLIWRVLSPNFTKDASKNVNRNLPTRFQSLNDQTICFTEAAWEDYVWWQRQDQKTLRRINQLIHNACRTPFEGLGKPEPLRESLSGFWSRRIDQANRLVYEDTDRALNVVSCRYHYG